jgi:hypothetical protein
LTLLVYITLILSLLANILLAVKLHSAQSSQRNLEQIMTPGKVGETFEIFTPEINWWDSLLGIPLPTQTVSRDGDDLMQRYRMSSDERAKLRYGGRQLTFGRGGKRIVFEQMERSIWETWKKTRMFVSDVVERVLGRRLK